MTIKGSINTGTLGITSTINPKILNPKSNFKPLTQMQNFSDKTQKSIYNTNVPSLKGLNTNMIRSKSNINNNMNEISYNALKVASTILENQKSKRTDRWERNLTSLSGQKRKFADDEYKSKDKDYRKTYTDTKTDLGDKQNENWQ